MSHREKKEALFAHLAAEFINRESNREALITVTRAQVSTDEKRVQVYISVLPESYEEPALSFLKRKRTEFREFAQKRARVRVLPVFDFEIDTGEKNRQALENLSS
jgi:ribosome-binding factor A